MQYERNRRNFNRQAAGSGLNTGTASQAALAQNSTWQRDYGNLRTAEADALARADQQMAALETQYKSAVAQAIAENDYNRAKALMDEYGNQENRDAAMAKTLASYGDFSGYARLYGDDVANNMAQYWISQNPKLAYDMGRISAEDYARLTGQRSGSGSGSRGGLFGGGKTGGTTVTTAGDSRSETVNAEQYKGLRRTLMQGNDAAAKSALDFITRNASKFTDQELSDLANYYMGR